MGPLPTVSPAAAAISPAQTALLELLAEQPRPVALSTLAPLAGLHENTVRGHLDALHRAGLARREQAVPDGRGRPAWLWSIAGAAATSEYAALATALVRSVRRVSTDPVRDALEAGREWGRERMRTHRPADRARGTGAHPTAAAPARRAVVQLLDAAGFAPQADARDARVALTRCPLLEAARLDTDVVCSVHLGLVQGALDELEVEDAGTELHPFAERGACVLHLRARARTDDGDRATTTDPAAPTTSTAPSCTSDPSGTAR